MATTCLAVGSSMNSLAAQSQTCVSVSTSMDRRPDHTLCPTCVAVNTVMYRPVSIHRHGVGAEGESRIATVSPPLVFESDARVIDRFFGWCCIPISCLEHPNASIW